MSKEIIIKEIEKIEKTINKKFDEYLNLIALSIKNLFNHFFQPHQKEEVSKKNKINSKIQIIKRIECKRKINSLCFLEDGRLVSGCNGRIYMYSKTFESEILTHYIFDIFSVCRLRNGNLASAGADRVIKIWEFNGKEHKKIHSLEGHNEKINKVIELEDGKLCSCSDDTTIKIWDNKANYRCIQTLREQNHCARSIVEINDYIISAGTIDDKKARIWNKYTFQPIKDIKGIYCNWNNGLEKIKENKIILGGKNEIFILDILSFEFKSFKTSQLGDMISICVFMEDQALLGDDKGQIFCFDSSCNQFTLNLKLHKEAITCITKDEDDKIFISIEGEGISTIMFNSS